MGGWQMTIKTLSPEGVFPAYLASCPLSRIFEDQIHNNQVKKTADAEQSYLDPKPSQKTMGSNEPESGAPTAKTLRGHNSTVPALSVE